MVLSKGQIRKIAAIAGEYGLDLVLVYGSAVDGNSHPGSDLDLAVRFRKLPGEYTFSLSLWAALQSVFPGANVDLAVVNVADPLFLQQIMKSSLKIFGSERDYAELEIYAWKQYIDYKPFLAMEEQFVESCLEL